MKLKFDTDLNCAIAEAVVTPSSPRGLQFCSRQVDKVLITTVRLNQSKLPRYSTHCQLSAFVLILISGSIFVADSLDSAVAIAELTFAFSVAIAAERSAVLVAVAVAVEGDAVTVAFAAGVFAPALPPVVALGVASAAGALPGGVAC